MKKTKTSKPVSSVKKSATRVSDRSTAVSPQPEVVMPKMNLLPKVSPLTYVIGAVVIVAVVGAVFFKNLFVVARVNGQLVTRLELNSELERLAGKQAINSLVTKVLIQQESNRRKVTVSDKETNDAIAKLSADLKKQGQDLDKLLVAQGMTKESLKEQMRIQTLVEKMFSKDVKVTDKEVTDYIEKNKEQLPTTQDEASLKNSVSQQLKQQKLSEVFQNWIATAQKNASISYYLNL